jgi:hypothetical protein
MSHGQRGVSAQSPISILGTSRRGPDTTPEKHALGARLRGFISVGRSESFRMHVKRLTPRFRTGEVSSRQTYEVTSCARVVR